MQPGSAHPFIILAAIGVDLVLILTADEVRALTDTDARLLRDCGASEAMLDRLRDLARDPDLSFRLDFDDQAVSIVTEK